MPEKKVLKKRTEKVGVDPIKELLDMRGMAASMKKDSVGGSTGTVKPVPQEIKKGPRDVPQYKNKKQTQQLKDLLMVERKGKLTKPDSFAPAKEDRLDTVSYLAMRELLLENNAPNIEKEEGKGIAMYNPFSNTSHVYKAGDLIAEAAHAQQNKTQAMPIRWLKDWITDPYINRNQQLHQYGRKGSMEYEAHTEIEPKLEAQFFAKAIDKIDKKEEGIPIYKEGGNIKKKKKKEVLPQQPNEDATSVTSFYKNYINSPNYSKRLRAQGYTNPLEVRQERADALGKIKFHITDKDSSHFDPTNRTAYIDIGERDQYNTSLDNIMAHETSHGIGALAKTNYFNPGNLGLNPNEIKAIDKRNSLSSYDEEYLNRNSIMTPLNIEKLHGSQATEVKADMDSLRYQLSRDAIYNTATQEFNSEYLKKAKEKYSGDKGMKRLFDKVKDEDLIYLMNNVASTQNTDNLRIAENGLNMKKTKKSKIRS